MAVPFPFRVTPVALLLGCAAAAAAESATEIEPIVVTATRTAETADETFAPVTVVTRRQIERQQARSTVDVLRGQPGVVLDSAGGPGRATNLYLRGTNANQVLFLVDGVKVGSASTGQTELQNLPLEQIERIEIVRGPRSSLYGSEAAGGVIQLFTRRGGGPLRPFVSATAGRYQTAGISGGLLGGGERGRFSVSGNFDQTDGFNACTGRGAPFFDGCGTFEPDEDGYRNVGYSASAGYDLSERLALDLRLLRSDSTIRFDGAFQNEAETVQQVLGAALRARPLEAWDLRLSAGRSSDEQENRKDGRFASDFVTRRDSLSLQNDLAIGAEHLLTLGADYQRDRVGGSVDYSVDSRENIGLFTQYQGWLGPIGVKASVRRDDNDQFGDHGTGDLALGWEPLPQTRLTASYGTAFTAPTFNDLYFPAGPFFAGGNPDLRPELSRSIELGATGRVDALHWSLNLFRTDIDDLITLVPPTFAAENIERARIRGLEGVVSGRLFGTTLSASVTLLDPRNRSRGPDSGNLLARRPEQTFRVDLDRDHGPFGWGATLFGSGRRFDDPANRVRIAGFTLLDLRASYAFSEALRLQATIENVFAEDYETVAFYNQPGRGVYLTLRYAPSGTTP